MITIAYTDLLLTVLTLSVVAGAVFLVMFLSRARIVLGKAGKVLDDVDRLTPKLERIAEGSEESLRGLAKLSQRADRIAEDVEEVTDETRRVAVPIIREAAHHADNAMSSLRHISALVAGARAGLDAWNRRNSR